MEQQSAMMQLLAQLKDERANMPLNIEWDRCYQAIEYVIQNTYISLEKEQIMNAYRCGKVEANFHPEKQTTGNNYYNKTFKTK